MVTWSKQTFYWNIKGQWSEHVFKGTKNNNQPDTIEVGISLISLF